MQSRREPFIQRPENKAAGQPTFFFVADLASCFTENTKAINLKLPQVPHRLTVSPHVSLPSREDEMTSLGLSAKNPTHFQQHPILSLLSTFYLVYQLYSQ